MSPFLQKCPPWWDRELDDAGRVIRADVRSAAIKVWQNVCDVVEKVRGDTSEACELLDKAVTTISFYLDKKGVGETDPGGLLVVAVHRAEKRRSRRERVIQAAGGTSELSEMLKAPDWVEFVERQLFLERLSSALSPATQAMLRLRMKGLTWTEIGKFLGKSPAAVRSQFWQDVRKAHLAILAPSKSSSKEQRVKIYGRQEKA